MSKRISSFVLLIGWLAVAAMPAWAQRSGSIEGGSVTLEPQQTPGNGVGVYDTMAPPSEEVLRAREERTARTHKRYPDQADPRFDPNDIRPTSPPTELRSLVRAPEDLEAFDASDVYPTSGFTSSISEPSLGVNGRVAFYTANWMAAFSGDYGQTWSFIDPYDNFPADGVVDNPANAGIFCCDQVVYYERTRGLMLWLLQYVEDGNTNIQRLAIARSQEDVLNNDWIFYDLAPALLDYPAGRWFDYPDLSVSSNFLYLTTNVFTLAGGFVGASVMRFSLDDLADGGDLFFHYWNVVDGSLRGANGTTTHHYFGTHFNTTTFTVYHVDEASTNMAFVDIPKSAHSNGFMVSTCPDGTNWAARSDHRVLAGWYSGGELGFMWNAAQAGGFPHPYTAVIRIDPATFGVVQEFQIWNPDFAWMYPSIHVNDRGHLGGTINYGGGGALFPGDAAFILDDFNGFPTWGPLTNIGFGNSVDGPNNHSWGDYNSTRRMVPYGNTWVGTAHLMGPGGGQGDATSRFIWFGRERDMPPDIHTIFVDAANATLYQTGEAAHPFRTVRAGETALSDGDNLIIVGGAYPEAVLFDTEATVESQGGAATVGGN